MPFATATALTAVARQVKDAEVAGLKATLKNPSPFTLNSVRMTAARKNNLTATVFVMNKAADYLTPYEIGGLHKLNSKALLNPKDIPLNQYGQLSKAVLSKLKARPDIFIGPVNTAKGIVNGVWQRPYIRGLDTSKGVSVKMRKKLRGQGLQRKGANTTGHLKLLIRFGDALPVKAQWNYMGRAKKIVAANLRSEFDKAMAQAIATSK